MIFDPPVPASKFPGTGTTIFTVMSKMAQDFGAINLAQGFPDFDGPPLLRERVAWHMANGHNQYAPLAGVPELLDQIAAKILDEYGRAVDPQSEIAVTPGATEAIHCAVSSCIHPGDEVIIFDPAYDTYAPCVRLNGGVCRHITMEYPDYRIDWRAVEEAVSERTRLIMLNSPHNPTGSLWREDDIESLRRLVRGRNILLLSDDVYEHITFDGHRHLSLLRYPDLAERAFCISSFGKTYHVTGWRIGYCVAPEALMREFLRVHQFINFATAAPMQYAIADFMREDPGFHRRLGDFYQVKRDLFCAALADSRFSVQPSAGTYFQMADYSAISSEPDTAFSARLTKEFRVAAIPVSVFCQQPPDQRVVRFCFAKSDETLVQAAKRLQKI